LSVRGESFVTQDVGYVQQLAARWPNKYETIVKFDMQPGTRQALLDAGRRSAGRLFEEQGLADIPRIGKGMPNVVHIKAEDESITYGLRPGSAHIFNSRIIRFGQQ
jgi:hypothetical protein